MRRGGGEHGCTAQGHPPAIGRCGCDEDAPLPHPPPPFPATEVSLEMSKMQQHEKEQQLTAELPEGPLVEILSRVPYRSLCRFKCVSKPWLGLCSDPEIRKRCPQTMTGFFYNTRSCGLSFCNLSGRGPAMVDPSLPFLRGRYSRVEVEQCCGGLLLCKYWKSYKWQNRKKFGFAVCNPVTGQWNVLPTIVLPDPEDDVPVIYDYLEEYFFASDAANPSHFVVFAPLDNGFGDFTQVGIFSSETQRWTPAESEWVYETFHASKPKCVLLNGTIHFATHYGTTVTVDLEGKVWGEFGMPDGMPDVDSYPSIGHSQGCLYAWQIDDDNGCKLYVWVLEDYSSGKWTLKHTVNVSELFGRQVDEDDQSYMMFSYAMFAIHPDCNLIFLTDKERMTVSYDMDTRKVHVICNSGEFLDGAPYIPCFVELSSDGC
uniref:Uncharacterized protein n=2 Tax=Avena sativa TaxID=4498 RepID=A0ACD5ZNN8_AVESA